jgi:ribosomal protein L11 methyltransferase
VTSRVLELRFRVPREQADALSALLFDAGAGAVEERDVPDAALLVVYCTGGEEVERMLGAARSLPVEVGVEQHELDDTWKNEWTRWLGPEAVTERVVLVPVGTSAPTVGDARILEFDPSLVFGVGSHPTTRLAAREVEELCLGRPGLRVLDVGTGTGVLAMVAAVSGAGSVLGIDVDAKAVRSARHNARLNDLGSLCRFSERPLSAQRRRWDLVVANIEVWILEELLSDLVRVIAPGGCLVVSGFLRERAAALGTELERLGLRVTRERSEGDWSALVLS